MSDIDPDTLLEWLQTGGSSDVTLLALEQLCNILLLSDNIDRCFESYPPRSFLPALCKIFLDEMAPDQVLEATARALTYYLDVSQECTRRIVAVEGTLRAICNRLLVIEVDNKCSKDLAEQCIKTLELICARESQAVFDAGGLSCILPFVLEHGHLIYKDTLHSAMQVVTRLCGKWEPLSGDAHQLDFCVDTLGQLLRHAEDPFVSDAALRCFASLSDRFVRRNCDPAPLAARGLVPELLRKLGESAAAKNALVSSTVTGLLSTFCRTSPATSNELLGTHSAALLDSLERALLLGDERCVLDTMRFLDLLLTLVFEGREALKATVPAPAAAAAAGAAASAAATPVTQQQQQQQQSPIMIIKTAAPNTQPLVQRAATNPDDKFHRQLVDWIRNKDTVHFIDELESSAGDDGSLGLVNYMDDVGQTLLNWAAAFGTPEMCEYLCARGADVNRGQRSSSLHYAACFGRAPIVRILLRYGANPELRDEEGKTALDKARERCAEGEAHRECVQILQAPPSSACVVETVAAAEEEEEDVEEAEEELGALDDQHDRCLRPSVPTVEQLDDDDADLAAQEDEALLERQQQQQQQQQQQESEEDDEDETYNTGDYEDDDEHFVEPPPPRPAPIAAAVAPPPAPAVEPIDLTEAKVAYVRRLVPVLCRVFFACSPSSSSAAAAAAAVVAPPSVSLLLTPMLASSGVAVAASLTQQQSAIGRSCLSLLRRLVTVASHEQLEELNKEVEAALVASEEEFSLSTLVELITKVLQQYVSGDELSEAADEQQLPPAALQQQQQSYESLFMSLGIASELLKKCKNTSMLEEFTRLGASHLISQLAITASAELAAEVTDDKQQQQQEQTAPPPAASSTTTTSARLSALQQYLVAATQRTTEVKQKQMRVSCMRLAKRLHDEYALGKMQQEPRELATKLLNAVALMRASCADESSANADDYVKSLAQLREVLVESGAHGSSKGLSTYELAMSGLVPTLLVALGDSHRAELFAKHFMTLGSNNSNGMLNTLLNKLVALLETVERLPVYLYDVPGSYNLQVFSKRFKLILKYNEPAPAPQQPTEQSAEQQQQQQQPSLMNFTGRTLKVEPLANVSHLEKYIGKMCTKQQQQQQQQQQSSTNDLNKSTTTAVQAPLPPPNVSTAADDVSKTTTTTTTSLPLFPMPALNCDTPKNEQQQQQAPSSYFSIPASDYSARRQQKHLRRQQRRLHRMQRQEEKNKLLSQSDNNLPEKGSDNSGASSVVPLLDATNAAKSTSAMNAAAEFLGSSTASSHQSLPQPSSAPLEDAEEEEDLDLFLRGKSEPGVASSAASTAADSVSTANVFNVLDDNMPHEDDGEEEGEEEEEEDEEEELGGSDMLDDDDEEEEELGDEDDDEEEEELDQDEDDDDEETNFTSELIRAITASAGSASTSDAAAASSSGSSSSQQTKLWSTLLSQMTDERAAAASSANASTSMKMSSAAAALSILLDSCSTASTNAPSGGAPIQTPPVDSLFNFTSLSSSGAAGGTGGASRSKHHRHSHGHGAHRHHRHHSSSSKSKDANSKYKKQQRKEPPAADESGAAATAAVTTSHEDAAADDDQQFMMMMSMLESSSKAAAAAAGPSRFGSSGSGGIQRIRELKRRHHITSSAVTSSSSSRSSKEKQQQQQQQLPPAPQMPQPQQPPVLAAPQPTVHHHHNDEFVLRCQFSALIPAFDPRPGKSNVNQIQDITVPPPTEPAVSRQATPPATTTNSSASSSSSASSPKIELYLKVEKSGAHPSGACIDFVQDEIKLSNKNATIFQYIQSLIKTGNSKSGEAAPSVLQQYDKMRLVWDMNYSLIYREEATTAAQEEAKANEPATVSPSTTTSSSSSFDQVLQLLATLRQMLQRVGQPATIDLRRDLVSEKLNGKLVQQLQEPLVLASRSLPDWCRTLAQHHKFLFPFETRQLYFATTAFGVSRSIVWLQNKRDSLLASMRSGSGSSPITTTATTAAARAAALAQLVGGSALVTTPAAAQHAAAAAAAANVFRGASGGDELEYRIGRLKHERVRVPREPRESLVRAAINVLKFHAMRKAVLEIEFQDEEGTGLGPTLEFYSLIAREMQRKQLGMWLCEDAHAVLGEEEFVHQPNGLFPAPHVAPSAAVLEYFNFLGIFLAKSLQDQRLVDIPFARPFLKLMCGHVDDDEEAQDDDEEEDGDLAPLRLSDLMLVDPHRAQLLVQMRKLLKQGGGGEMLLELGDNGEKTRLEDLGLVFAYDPPSRVFGYAAHALVPDGENVPVTEANCAEYVRLMARFLLKVGVERQLEAFREGFDSVFSMDALRCFEPHELQLLLSGDQAPAWTRDDLINYTEPKLGYTRESPGFLRFVNVMCDMTAPERKRFVQFLTGCSSLPPGGLANLHPRLTVVRKDGNDFNYPSVNTCVHYLKLPDYSSEEVLKRQLDVACREQGFYLN